MTTAEGPAATAVRARAGTSPASRPGWYLAPATINPSPRLLPDPFYRPLPFPAGNNNDCSFLIHTSDASVSIFLIALDTTFQSSIPLPHPKSQPPLWVITLGRRFKLICTSDIKFLTRFSRKISYFFIFSIKFFSIIWSFFILVFNFWPPRNLYICVILWGIVTHYFHVLLRQGNLLVLVVTTSCFDVRQYSIWNHIQNNTGFSIFSSFLRFFKVFSSNFLSHGHQKTSLNCKKSSIQSEKNFIGVK